MSKPVKPKTEPSDAESDGFLLDAKSVIISNFYGFKFFEAVEESLSGLGYRLFASYRPEDRRDVVDLRATLSVPATKGRPRTLLIWAKFFVRRSSVQLCMDVMLPDDASQFSAHRVNKEHSGAHSWETGQLILEKAFKQLKRIVSKETSSHVMRCKVLRNVSLRRL